ncbi:unnamed protein product, partial [Heterosigma akashiwo]
WKDHISSAGIDGAPTNTGRHSGIIVRMRELDLPWLKEQWCGAHRVERTFAEAVKDLKLWEGHFEMLQALHSFYKYFPKAVMGLRNAAGTDPQLGSPESVILPKRVKGTRWVAFMLNAIVVPQKQFKLFAVHLQQQGDVRNRDGREKRIPKASGILRKLTDVHILLFSYCMMAILDILQKLSKSFQSKNANPASAHKAVKTCLGQLQRLETDGFPKANQVRADLREEDGKLFHQDIQLNQGTRTRLQDYLGAANGPNLQQPFNDAKRLVGELREIIKRRYNGSDDPLLVSFQLLNTVWAVNGVPATPNFGHNKVSNIVNHYRLLLQKKVKDGFDFDAYLGEWDEIVQFVADLKEMDPNLDDLQVWKAVLAEGQRESKWVSMAFVIKIMLVHPVHTCDNERGFSLAKRYKTDSRSSLKTKRIGKMMAVKLLGPGYKNYNPQ